jgi:hypothetical protein
MSPMHPSSLSIDNGTKVAINVSMPELGVAFLFSTREVPGSNLGPETGCFQSFFELSFPHIPPPPIYD